MIGQRRDRTGEPIDDDDAEGEQHHCDGGWLDRDAAQPCLTCKPWLAVPLQRREQTERRRRERQ